jgi:dihydroxy-acid dehydratase
MASNGEPLDIVSAFQSYGQFVTGAIDEAERSEIVRKSCPGAGACGGMYTANTMASAIEALGMSLPYSSSIPAEDPLKMDECFMAGKAIKHMLEIDLKPRDIMTRAAFENAMVIIIALGGSTNAVLHLIAMAHAVGITLTLDDFQAVSDRVPFIADLKPSGKYVMEDVHKIGGTPGVLKVRVAERLESVCLFSSVRRPFFRFGLAPRSLRLLAPGKEKMKLLDSPSIASGRCR